LLETEYLHLTKNPLIAQSIFIRTPQSPRHRAGRKISLYLKGRKALGISLLEADGCGKQKSAVLAGRLRDGFYHALLFATADLRLLSCARSKPIFEVCDDKLSTCEDPYHVNPSIYEHASPNDQFLCEAVDLSDD
jgi:hypothetical protein